MADAVAVKRGLILSMFRLQLQGAVRHSYQIAGIAEEIAAPAPRRSVSSHGSLPLFQRREGCWREDLIADARDDGSIALTIIADLVPGRVVLERRPLRLAICQRLP